MSTPNKLPVIVLIGIDGTGKSTQAFFLHAHLTRRRIKSKIIYAGNTGIRLGKSHSFYLSQPVDIIMRKIFKKTTIYPTPFSSLINILLFFNYVFLILPKIMLYKLCGYTLILDRYIYDYILSTIIKQSYSPLLSRLLVYLSPSPSVVILLDMPPEMTHKRKQEEKTVMEIHLSRLLYLDFYSLAKIPKVNANNTLDAVFLSILRQIEKSHVGLTPQLVVSIFDTITKKCSNVYE